MSKSEALRAYLLKNYASKEKRKKRKNKPRNYTQSISTSNKTKMHHDTNRQHTNDRYESTEMRMPDLNDGSGWKNEPNILALEGRKRKHSDDPAPSTKRIKRQRYDTDSEDDTANKVRYDTSDEDDSDMEVDRKAVQNEHASDTDSDIEVERKPTAMIKEEENGNKTVYRDKSGKRISEKEYNEMKLKHSKRNKNDEHMEWASGLVQKYKAFEKAVVLQRQRYKSLARYKDDAEMNIDLQNEHRKEDPLNVMEGYGNKKRDNHKEIDDKTNLNQRPMYRGKPWPNRYGILPGYRWDGVDRANGFEAKKLLQVSQRKDTKNRRYRAANSDM